MTKKKVNPTVSEAAIASDQDTVTPPPSLVPKFISAAKSLNAKVPEQHNSTLLICRNKHWRYISSYHGPWLQLPPEVLQSLAYSNYYSPRPQPIDPAVFFDLVKIRVLIEEATSLAVRASNGTTSAALSSSFNAGHGILNSNDAELLGLSFNRGGGNAKLSRERKHRMREHATQKLAHAYQLDEIAASVATMQSASALEGVAKLVLQRNENDPDAKYVHFFHEKIPSRALAESTSLQPLSDVIAQKPAEGGTYRTRAVTRIFKEDFLGAVRDLTEGLGVFKMYHTQHQNEQRDLVLARDTAKLTREYKSDAKVDERDQPSSLEPQFLFHRAGTYLTLACDHIEAALTPSWKLHQSNGHNTVKAAIDKAEKNIELPADQDQIDARKMVRTYAKRALRDYTSFLSHFDYTPGLSAEFTEAFLENFTTVSPLKSNSSRSERLLDVESHSTTTNITSEALIRYENKDRPDRQELSPIPNCTVYKLNALFAAIPPDLPPYPSVPEIARTKAHSMFSLPDFSEAVTYHPLLTDVLHSLLLCHCLIQTSLKEHLRHAHMAARITRACDGYPIFLAARSPARADWVEVVRRARNWLGLEASWDKLCAPTPQTGPSTTKKMEVAKDKQERVDREPIKDAWAADRVHDEESFRATLRARELRAAREEEEEQRKEYLRTTPQATGRSDGNGPRCASHEHVKGHSSTRERADVIARWILEAPQPSTTGEGRTKKNGRKFKSRKEFSDVSNMQDIERSVDSLDLLD